MDLTWIVTFVILVALAFYALERFPFPAQPPWLRKGVEVLVAIGACYILAQRLGILHA